MAFDAKRLDRVLATAGAPSLADMMVCVRDDASLSSTRRRDLASAVRRTTAALVLPVDQVPADPAWLQPQLRALRLRALGLAKVADEPLQRLEGGAGGHWHTDIAGTASALISGLAAPSGRARGERRFRSSGASCLLRAKG